jgi:hypothetical protein
MKVRIGLTFFSIIYLLNAAVGTLIALRRNLSADFGGFFRGQGTFASFALKGTALSAPLVLLIIQLTLTLLIWSGHRAGRLAQTSLAVLGGVYFIGQLGEPLLWQTLRSSPLQVILLVVLALNLALPVGLLLFGMAARKTA